MFILSARYSGGGLMDYHGVELKVLQGDVLRHSSDLLVLKYAQASYGADKKAVEVAGIDTSTLPAAGESILIQKPSGLASYNLLLLGVEPLMAFGYGSIREFSRRALVSAMEVLPPVREIAMTLHGAGYGLDEIEAFESEVAGIVEALDAGNYPRSLETVSIIERTNSRADRMRSALAALLRSAESEMRIAEPSKTKGRPQQRRIDSVGYNSSERPHAFVAMPFAEPFEDVFYFGISAPVRAAGLLCERIDQVAFTGDIIDRMKERIASSAVVVADLSDANPNVYLEVGYAWGMDRPCILICNRKTDLKFDLRGQRCLFYSTIKELEKSLSAELTALARQIRSGGVGPNTGL
jgi:hypothetical protein